MYNSGGASIHAEVKGVSCYRLWSAPVTKNPTILSREVEPDNVEVCSISPATAALWAQMRRFLVRTPHREPVQHWVETPSPLIMGTQILVWL